MNTCAPTPRRAVSRVRHCARRWSRPACARRSSPTVTPGSAARRRSAAGRTRSRARSPCWASPWARRGPGTRSWRRSRRGSLWAERRALARGPGVADRDRRAPGSRTMRTVGALLLLASLLPARAGDDFRPPAVPLVVQDPYVSVWSFSDRLTDDWPRHWTGKVMAMCGMARIDDKPYRWCGPQPAGVPEVPAMEQMSLRVGALSTDYTFTAEGVQLTVGFVSPALPWDLDRVGSPVTLVTWQARAIDGAEHRLAIYADVSGEWVVDTPDQDVEWGRVRLDMIQALRLGSADQRVLRRSGDDVRLDWGHLYLAMKDTLGREEHWTGTSGTVAFGVGAHDFVRNTFVQTGEAPQRDDLRQPRPASDDWPVFAVSIRDARVFPDGTTIGPLLIGCDEIRNIALMEQPLRPWWQQHGADIGAVLAGAQHLENWLRDQVTSFEHDLHADLVAFGVEHYAQVWEP